MEEDNYDSSDDSDYNPNDKNEDDIINNDNSKNTTLESSKMSFSRKRKVDSIMNELVESDRNELLTRKSKLLYKNYKTNENSSNNTNEIKIKTNKKNKKILESIFGKSQAHDMLSNISHYKAVNKSNEHDIKQLVKDSIAKVQKKQKVNEIRKFAGKEIIVETTKLTTAYGDNADFKETITIKEKKPVNALDAVLDSIKGPKVISTITKSSIDWSNYKEKEGLEDELAVSAKDGYLTRKEFLERCDVRSYENEKTLRMDSSS